MSTPAKLLIEFAGVHPDYANPAMGMQGTGGSTSIMGHFLQLRQVGADTRQAIVLAAAGQLGVPPREIATDDGYVVARGARHPYGAFVATAAERALPENTPLKPDAEFRYIGKELPRIDSIGKATGTTTFGIDIDIPDMHHAVVQRSPVAGGSVASFDGGKALAMPGVIGVVEVDTGVAVVAQKHWQAQQAASEVQVEWNLPALAGVNTAQVQADYRAALANEEGESAELEGDPETALAASLTVAADYWAPYLAHAPMEPMNAVVRIEHGEADVWSGTQAIGAAQGLVARGAGLDKDRVRAHSTYLGGAFGRRPDADARRRGDPGRTRDGQTGTGALVPGGRHPFGRVPARVADGHRGRHRAGRSHRRLACKARGRKPPAADATVGPARNAPHRRAGRRDRLGGGSRRRRLRRVARGADECRGPGGRL